VSEPATTELRREIAASRGLGERALAFLDADTVQAIEAQADELVALLGTTTARDEQDPAPAADPITLALQAKARRRRALVQAVLGRPEQPRDEHGRYTGFDGGPRGLAPTTRKPPEQEHAETILALARIRALGG
jgi:hypothetical protein